MGADSISEVGTTPRKQTNKNCALQQYDARNQIAFAIIAKKASSKVSGGVK